MSDDATVTTHVSGVATAPTHEPGVRPALRSSEYEIESVIGSGGMGEVLLASDRRIGREVAIKRMLGTKPTAEQVALFLREARIQARLDHPAVVPVFELGEDEAGRPYFAMKRLTGRTLHELLRDPSSSPQRLLRAFVDVCLVIDLAHEKGVIHCDLKPTNVMLGNYGEVYVLDWGIARVDEGHGGALAELALATSGVSGTPGYMAPEQALGDVRPASDVYSLGCILFEILVREPLQPRETDATTRPMDADSAARRRPDRAVPPELDQLCTASIAPSIGDRPTARALAEGVQRYLDGDRDLELRKALAVAKLAEARSAHATGDRALAIQGGSAALALDPASRDAAALVGQLMLQPPVDPPPELRAELAAADASDVRRHARRAALAYLVVIPLLPLAIWNGIESWAIVIAAFGTALTLSAFAWWLVVRPERTLFEMALYASGNALFIGLLVRAAGPFTFVPAIVSVLTASLSAYPIFARRSWLLLSLVGLGWVIPIVVELAGWVSPTWSVEPRGILMHNAALTLHGTATSLLVFAVCLAAILISGQLAATIATGHHDAKQRLVSQAWHLRQLLPPIERAKS